MRDDFWMINAIDDVTMHHEGDTYIYSCDMNKDENWYRFETKYDDGEIIMTFMFRFTLAKKIKNN